MFTTNQRGAYYRQMNALMEMAETTIVEDDIVCVVSDININNNDDSIFKVKFSQDVNNLTELDYYDWKGNAEDLYMMHKCVTERICWNI